MNTKPYFVVTAITATIVLLIVSMDDAVARGRGGGGGGGRGGFSRSGAAASGSFSSSAGRAGSLSAGRVRRPPHPELPAGHRPLRPIPRTGRKLHSRLLQIGRRLCRAVSRLRRRIKPNGSNIQVKTSRSAKKDALHGLARASKRIHGQDANEATNRAAIPRKRVWLL